MEAISLFIVGDVVIYSGMGICKVCAIEKRNMTGRMIEYYILRHLYDDRNTYYIPVNDDALKKLHPVCTKQEVNSLISHMNSEKTMWIENEIKRKEEYSRIIRDADKRELIRLIKTLYLRRSELIRCGRRMRAFDENLLKLAEDLLFDEFAYDLGIERNEVVDYIEKHIT